MDREELVCDLRRRLARWDRAIDRIEALARESDLAPREVQPIRSLLHKKESVEVKLEALSRSPASRLGRIRRELEAEWAELVHAYATAVRRVRADHGDGADGAAPGTGTRRGPPDRSRRSTPATRGPGRVGARPPERAPEAREAPEAAVVRAANRRRR